VKQRFFDLARKLSKHSCHHKAQLGAVIVKGSQPIGLGFNKLKTTPKSTHPWRAIHAETAAILNAKTDISGCDIYIFRENKNGEMAMSKPCTYCHLMLVEAGIRRVYYTTENGTEMMKL